MRYIFSLIAIVLVSNVFVSAQGALPDIGIQSNLALGVVKAIGNEKISVETKDGEIDVVLQSFTVFKRMSPDNLKPSAAQDALLSDIAVTDRVLVTGKVSADKKSIYADKVFLVKGTDLEAQAEAQRREWRMRGISGKVESVDSATRTVTVMISSVVGEATKLALTVKDGVKFKRYSEESARYSDAVESSFDEISAGDNIQALGDKSEDGMAFAAEEVISGSFITVAGTVKSVDVAKNEVTISDLETEKDLIIVVNGNSMVKEFPEEIAQRLAMFLKMGGAAAAGSGGGRRGAGGGPGGGMGDINQLLNRFPTIGVGDLKMGTLIAVSSPKPKVPGRITAIKLLAGVGPFLAAKSGGSKSRGVAGSLNVPGLDSFDF